MARRVPEGKHQVPSGSRQKRGGRLARAFIGDYMGNAGQGRVSNFGSASMNNSRGVVPGGWPVFPCSQVLDD